MEEIDFGKCTVCGTGTELVDAVSSEEIIKVCANCAKNNNFPVIKRPTQEQISLSHKYYSKSFVKTEPPVRKEKSPADKELEKFIRDSAKKQDYPDLIENFHWHIQHGRRMKKLSVRQLADSVAEPEVLIEMAEQGKLPPEHEKLIIKLEQFLGIKVRNTADKAPEIVSDQVEGEEEQEEKKSGFFSRMKSWFSASDKPESEEAEVESSEEVKE